MSVEAGTFSAENLHALEQGIDHVLAKIESALALEVYAEDIPIIGDKLKTAFDQGQAALHTIKELKNAITGAIRDLANAQTYLEAAVEAKINEAMAKAGFVDAAVDAIVNGEQITFAFTTDKVLSYTQTLAADFGLAELGLTAQTAGEATAEISYSFDFTVGVDGTTPDSFFLQTNGSNPELALGLSVATPGLAADATLCFLNFDAVDMSSSLSGSFAVDIKDNDGKLRLSELGNDVLDARLTGSANLDLHLSADMGDAALPKMSADLAVNWAFSSNIVNPNDTNSNFGGAPTVAFNNVSYDFGTFVEDFIRPILDKLDPVLQPIHQALAVFKTDLSFLKVVPGWEDLLDKAGKIQNGHDAGDGAITLIDFVKLANPSFELGSTLQFIQLVDDIVEWAEFFQGKDFGADQYDLGSFQILEDIRDTAFDLSKVTPNVTAAAADLSGFLNGLTLGGFGERSETGQTGQQILQNMFSETSFAFPILKNPMEAFKLLLGGNASLFSLDLPALNIGFGDFDSYGNPTGNLIDLGVFPIIPGIDVKFAGALELAIDMAFGYDTRGLQQFIESGFQDFASVFNGFYVSDQVAGGVDLPELSLSAAVEIAVQASILLASVGGGGNIAGQILLNLNDAVNGSSADGKIYLDEMVNALLTNPFAIFDASGQITAGLAAYVNVAGWDVWRYNSPRIVVGSFTFSDNPVADVPGAPPPPPPGLANIIGESLVLNIGTRAGERDISNKTDGGESVQIGKGPSGATIVGFGHTERFGDVTSLTGHGGAQDDSIVLAEDVSLSAHLSGEDGSDILYGGAATDSIDGGAGRDFLEGRGEADTLRGGAGNDVLTGGAGADLIDGGEGLDIASYATANDGVLIDLATGQNHGADAEGDTYTDIEIIEGSRSADTLSGGVNVDIFVGLDADDFLAGQENNDVLVGGLGSDTLDGGAGDDVMYGGSGDDLYHVDSLSDSVDENGDGQAGGRDRIVASLDYSLAASPERVDIEELELTGDARSGSGNALANLIIGTAGSDTLDGRAGADTLEGGSGNDLYIFDNAGDCVVEAAGSAAGLDTIIYDSASASSIVLSIDNDWGANVEDLWAKSVSARVDLIGNAQSNLLTGNGLGGDVFGRGGDDIIRPGEGAKSGTYSGDGGNDRFELGTVVMNNQSIFDGGEGYDTLTASFAGSGFRAYFYRTLDYVDKSLREELYQFGDGWETTRVSLYSIENLTLIGSSLADFFTGTAGSNIYFGEDGEDNFFSVKNREDQFFQAGYLSSTGTLGEIGGVDLYDGGSGWDSIAVEVSDVAVNFSLKQAQTTDVMLGTGANTTTLRNIEDISLVTGNAADNFDLRGADLLARSSLDDYSTALKSVYYSGGGNDVLEIDDTGISVQETSVQSSITFDGETGNDSAIVDFSHFKGRISTSGSTDGYGSITLTDYYISSDNPGTVSLTLGLYDVENITLNSGNETDFLQDLGNNESIHAGGGDDFVNSRVGNDTLNGGSGFDELELHINTLGEGVSVKWADQFTGPLEVVGSDRTVTFQGFERLSLTTTDGNDTFDVRGVTTKSMNFYAGEGDDTFIADIDEAKITHAFGGAGGIDTLVIDGRGLNTSIIVSHTWYYDYQTGKTTTYGAGYIYVDKEVLDRRLDFSGVETIVAYGSAAGDTYEIFSKNDKVFESAGGGQDVVNAYIDYELTENVEELWLEGADAKNGTGNTADNVISDSIASNRLVGAGGKDKFVINTNVVQWTGTAVTAVQTDEILDFADDDTLLLRTYNGWYFSGLVEGDGTNIVNGEIAVLDLGDGRTAFRWGVDEIAGYDKELILSGLYTAEDFTASEAGYNQTLLQVKTAPVPTMLGTEADNVLTGTDADDFALALGGNDDINTMAGRATVEGGSGTDRWQADLSAFDATQSVALDLRAGTSTIAGHSGIISGVEWLNLTTGDGADEIITRSEDLDDRVYTSGGDDLVQVSGGVDEVDGGDGEDLLIVDYSESDLVVTTSTASGFDRSGNQVLLRQFIDASGHSVSAANFENFSAFGGSADDYLVGGDGQDSLTGNRGDDTLNGGDGYSDVATYSGSRSDYRISMNLDGTINVTDKRSDRDGRDVAKQVEYFDFADGRVYFAHLLSVEKKTPDQIIAEDTTWSFTIPDGIFVEDFSDLVLVGSLEYGYPLPEWLSFNPETRTFSGTPPKDFNGKLELMIRASSGSLIGVDRFTLTIYPVDDTPPTPPTPPVVVVSSSYVLPADGRDITATGNAPVSLTGNAAANVIKGNTGKNTIRGDAGNDVVAGKLGNDTLYGGRDKDAFVFDTKANKRTNVDRIVDFNVSDDSVWLDNAVFKGLGSKGTLTKPVQLSSKMFWSGTKAHDQDDRVIYDKKSGALYYDADGTGSAAQVKIATLSKNLKMTYKDFFVV
jgi:Ca2+-binding RTX toxin-like protein